MSNSSFIIYHNFWNLKLKFKSSHFRCFSTSKHFFSFSIREIFIKFQELIFQCVNFILIRQFHFREILNFSPKFSLRSCILKTVSLLCRTSVLQNNKRCVQILTCVLFSRFPDPVIVFNLLSKLTFTNQYFHDCNFVFGTFYFFNLEIHFQFHFHN